MLANSMGRKIVLPCEGSVQLVTDISQVYLVSSGSMCWLLQDSFSFGSPSHSESHGC